LTASSRSASWTCSSGGRGSASIQS
jgi:hypothetical protein